MSVDLRRVIEKVIAATQKRVRTMIGRAIVELVDDSRKLQSLQISGTADVLRDDVERFQQYGFSSVPAVGAEAIVLLVGGGSDHPVVIAVDDRRYRPKDLEEGESCLYTLGNGVRVRCKADGTVEIGTEPSEFAARADRVEAELEKLQTAHNGHTHSGVVTGVTGMATGTVGSSGGPNTSYTPASVEADEVKIT